MSIGPLIDDSNYYKYRNFGSRGYKGMFEFPEDKGKLRGFEAMGIPLIDESEWDDRLRESEKQKSRIYDFCTELQLPCKDQKHTNYCWVNAPTHCCEITRLMETGQVYSYSPASAGAPIKNFRNVGGWGSEALDYFKFNGLNFSEDWPDNEIKQSYYTEENRERAKRHTVLEWFILNSWEERVSCLLANIPIASGYNWWGHEITDVGITIRKHDLVIRNSWGMSWGDKGFGTLSGSRKHSDESIAVVAMLPI